MFIYKTTETTSGKFYIGVDTRHRREFDTTIDPDPMNVFIPAHSNVRNKALLNRCSKHLLYFNSDKSAIDSFIKKFNADNASNSLYITIDRPANTELEPKLEPRVDVNKNEHLDEVVDFSALELSMGSNKNQKKETKHTGK